jgi:hypothetical protein
VSACLQRICISSVLLFCSFVLLGSYEKGDFDTPLDPMKNETIHAGLEGLYLLSSPIRDMKTYGKNLTGATPASL